MSPSFIMLGLCVYRIVKVGSEYGVVTAFNRSLVDVFFPRSYKVISFERKDLEVTQFKLKILKP